MIDFTINLMADEWTTLMEIAVAYLTGVFILMPKKLRWSVDSAKKKFEVEKKKYIEKRSE